MTNNQNNFQTDLLIIGAGPVGLFAIFEAGMLKIKCQVIDTLEHIGGQCNALYPEKPIYDIPAHPKILASELIDNLESQARAFNPVYHLGQRADYLTKNADGSFLVTTSKNNKITARAIIIAAGCGAFGPNRPPLKNIEEYEGKSIFYSIASKAKFADKNVVIAGGGDSAVDWAISLAEICKKIYLVHRRDKFRSSPESAERLKKLAGEGKIELVVPYQLEGLKGNDGNLSAVIVKDFQNNLREIAADYLLPFYGLAMELGPIANWGLNLNRSLIEVDASNMRTSIAGIYAIGDIANYKNKLKLILTGFSEAAFACHDIYSLIFPDTPFHFEYSTSKKIS